ncbi:OCRE domain-containing protein [Methanobacterium sp. MBAC-LM]|uniref:OCRE domain-containing protein n=1 Tax=Methanobacterium sp. MBAC-LM TaxID=3412034 RepID=UPI003C72D3B3
MRRHALTIVVLVYILSIIGTAAADESVSNDSDSSDLTENFTPVDPDNTTDDSATSDNETTYQIDPTTGFPIDPETGDIIDPTTGNLIDPETGNIISSTSNDNETTYQTDPTTGYIIDPETGYLIDPTTGALIDPETGYLIDPETGDITNSTTEDSGSDNITYPIIVNPIFGDGNNSDIEPIYVLAKETSDIKYISFSQDKDTSKAENKNNITANEISSVLTQINSNENLTNKTLNSFTNNNEHFMMNTKNSTSSNSSTVPPKNTGNPFLPFLMIFGGVMAVKIRK